MNKIGKYAARKIAAILSRAMKFTSSQKLVSDLESYLALLSGKGAGQGWDDVNQISAIAKFLPRRPCTILDVGANDGRWSQELARVRNNPDDRYFLFEPAPFCFAGLEKRLPSIPNASLYKLAISDAAGAAILNIPDVSSGLASLHQRRDVMKETLNFQQLTVDTITLDEFCATHGIDAVDLLKMDIEGHELHAFIGAKRLLSSGNIKTVAFEFGSSNINSRIFFRDMWEIFADKNYKLYRLAPGSVSFPVDKYSETLEYYRAATNYIAISLPLA